MRHSPISRLLAGRTLRLLLALLALVEAHFIADSLETLIGIVVRNGGTFMDTVLLLALNSPEVIDFALPIAILIGLFFAISAARDENELVVCAAAGVNWVRIPGFALRIGLIGCAVSIFFAGFLTPIAKYTQRLAIHTIETRRALEEIRVSSPKSSIRTVENRTFVATPPEDDGGTRGGLMIFEADTGAGWRVSQASDWDIEGPGPDGGFSVRLQSFRDYREHRDGTEAPATEAEGLAQQLEFAKIRVENLAVDFRLEEVIRAVNRARRGDERLLIPPEALLRGADMTRVIDRRFGEILARAMLCVFAASVAVAAVAWSGTRRGRLLALPVAVVLVLGVDVGARALLGDAAAAGATPFALAFAGFTLFSTVAPMAYVARRREGIIAPGRSRA